MDKKVELDTIDRAIIDNLQTNARMTNADLARRVGLSPPGLQKRLHKLEEAGIIRDYVALVNREALDFDMLCFVQVTLKHHEPQAVSRFRELVQDMPEVLECHHLTGEFDYLLKVILRNRKHLERFLMDTLTPLPGMDRIRTSLVLSEIKTTTAVPINPDVG